jgi:hypothetical protein
VELGRIPDNGEKTLKPILSFIFNNLLESGELLKMLFRIRNPLLYPTELQALDRAQDTGIREQLCTLFQNGLCHSFLRCGTMLCGHTLLVLLFCGRYVHIALYKYIYFVNKISGKMDVYPFISSRVPRTHLYLSLLGLILQSMCLWVFVSSSVQ